ncbi:hypothetical protein QNA08_12500 [Chelatococcus sp. SYSU_G07232]|uniref:DUF308 domain-containing protein n=1 Tax=Chelatococcus albus TaxID=3047466 RepID=A0ABT7AI48_9HYPH|nr:hypothetical protein [Chelatococcus sp. SYSU_G07232]MDJ1159057.1 hypothetical protein [Chelatococcus sp. SYSU_G07232]
MVLGLFVVAGLFFVGGIAAIVSGSDIIVLERGWSMVIAGSVAATGGALLAGLGLVLRELKRLAAELAAAPRAAPAPLAGAAPALAAAGAAAALAAAGSAAQDAQEDQHSLDLRPPEPAAPEAEERRPEPSRPAEAERREPVVAAWGDRFRFDEIARPAGPAAEAPAENPAGARAEEPAPEARVFRPEPPSWLRKETAAPAAAEKKPLFPWLKTGAEEPAEAAPRPSPAEPDLPDVPDLAEPGERRAERMPPELPYREASYAEPSWPELLPEEAAEAPRPAAAAGRADLARAAEAAVAGALAAERRPGETADAAEEKAAPVTEAERGGAKTGEEAIPTVVGTYSAGGNLYVMFSDGSIEAETTRGVFRFTSLDELKSYIAKGEIGKGETGKGAPEDGPAAGRTKS